MIRTCKYKPCSAAFHTTDSRQLFCGPTCRANQHYADHPEKGRSVPPGPLQSVAAHPLTEAREAQEARDLDRKLGQVIHQAIIDLLERTGEAHADDLEPYYPEGHRDRCRKLQPGRFGSLRSRGQITRREDRKSKVKSRNGARSGVYIFTAEGQRKLAGHRVAGVPSAEASSSAAALSEARSPVSGDSTAGVGVEGERQSNDSLGVDPGGGSSVAPLSPVAEESSPTLFDASEARGRPRSAWTDAEEIAA